MMTQPKIPNLPGNSKKSKEKADKVISGEFKEVKKSKSKKFTEVFFGDNLSSVFSYLVQDVLIPSAKETLYNMITGGSEVWLWGEKGKKSNNPYHPTGGQRINYGGIFTTNPNNRSSVPPVSRVQYNDLIDEIVFTNRGDAVLVLDILRALVDEYGAASVADLYERIGKTGEFTDNNRGWTDLRFASVKSVRGGYLLVLPPVVKIN